MDNVFVIATIFAAFQIPREFQHRVLFWGVLGVIALRALMIGFGASLVANFGWVLHVFAVFLILTGIRLMFAHGKMQEAADNPLVRLVKRRWRVTPALHGHKFFVRIDGTLHATPLLLALVAIELADVIFAVDSVPAIFAITTDTFIVYTSNIFAILGLRALYFALAAVLHRFAYLKHALALLLVFIGAKVFVADALGWQKFPPAWSLGVTFVILTTGVAYSLWRTRPGVAPPQPPV